ncbi:MAG TPA: ATP-binding cassette domain-containing protein, partial [Pseudomonas sp.]|nr:ATP-binding cassette domain-containing protein [Pseudomonas sp.]
LGGNGAGKSSLLRLLAGMLDAKSGRLLLDDVGIDQLDPSDRRHNIGYLPQDVALLYGTLRENLNLENAALSDDDLYEALDGVGLGDWVRSDAKGLDLLIQGNASLSGGQRQAIGLARVLLQDPTIVLLDEPTAAFDQTSEKHVVEYLRGWLAGRTLIVVTHKKIILELVERAIVMRQGRVIMDGALDQLVQDNRVQTPDAKESLHGL